MSRERMWTISRGEECGHCLWSAELVKAIGRLNVAAMSDAQRIPSRPSMEKCSVVGLRSLLEVIVW